MLECDLTLRPLEIVERLLALEPRIVGLGVYVWNVSQTTEVVALLKRLRPNLTVILGGPEVLCETDLPPVAALADYIITGEADLKFAELCQAILAGTVPAGASPEIATTSAFHEPQTLTPSLSPAPSGGEGVPLCGAGEGASARFMDTGHRCEAALDRARSDSSTPTGPTVIHAGHAELGNLALPYDFYSDADIAHRIIYVESSRGCPFGCEFCLSSLDAPVRHFDLDVFLDAMRRLLERGVRHFKFVDRTFNLDIEAGRGILDFFLARLCDGLFLHFEMVPDRLPVELREGLARFPAGTLQLELGIQTFNDEVARRINRRQDYGKIAENLGFLRQQTRAHLHTDLIVGLPGESLGSIVEGFDRLIALGPHEIQVGILKRLRGAPIARHDEAWSMVYSPSPPYELIESKTLDFLTIQRLRRFARFWDLFGNSGNFIETTPLLWAEGASPFACVLGLSDWIFAQVGRQHAIALPRLAEFLHNYLTRVQGRDPVTVAASLGRDYQRAGRSEELRFPGDGAREAGPARPAPRHRSSDRRQARHRGFR